MKIAIIGYSGSGKSTLTRILSEKYSAPALHFDTIQFLPGWKVRDFDQKLKMTKDFLDNNDSWVIDGTYSRYFFDRRMQEADVIIVMLFNRFSGLFRAFKRYLTYKGSTRPDMAEGCNEKFDLEFVKWILWKGRTKEVRTRFADVIKTYPEKTVVIKNQRMLTKYIKNL